MPWIKYLPVLILSMVTGCADSVETIEGVTVKTHTKFYSADPKSPQDIKTALSRSSPVGFHGRLDWNVDWDTHTHAIERKCLVTAVTVSVDLRYTMPKLSRAASKDTQIREVFDAYYAKLKMHEDNHAQHGIDAGKAIQDLKNSLREGSDCRKLESAFNQKVYRIIRKHAAMDKAYDTRTGHGRTEGLVLP